MTQENQHQISEDLVKSLTAISKQDFRVSDTTDGHMEIDQLPGSVEPATSQAGSPALMKGENSSLSVLNSTVTMVGGNHYQTQIQFTQVFHNGPLPVPGERNGAEIEADSAIGASNDSMSMLSEKVYMCKEQPLSTPMTYMGKLKTEGGYQDIAVTLISSDETKLKYIHDRLQLMPHPNVVRIIEAGELHNNLFPHIYIATELCSQTLKDVFGSQDFTERRKLGPNDFKTYASIVKQIFSGVAFLHENNILHRDIKPENILVSSSGDKVLVSNFGLSTNVTNEHSVTASARGVGADGFRAPELLQQNPRESFRSDTFSIGIVLAMLFANGQHPFGSDPSRWRTNITDGQGLDLSHIVEFEEPYSESKLLLVNLIEQCLQHNSQMRRTPKEMLQHDFLKISLTDWAQLSEDTYMCNKRRIQKGKMVFKGKQKIAGEWLDVAVKLFQFNEECFKEIKRHLTLGHHSNLIKMHSTGVTEGPPSFIYITMELCCVTLKDFIEKCKQNPFDFLLYFSVAKQIVSGVAHIHENGFLHRNIKLENILLRTGMSELSKDKVEVGVADLGLSKLLRGGYSAATYSSRGVGADGYQAPEIHLENPVRSQVSDTFSLGIVLTMLFSNGQHPFGSDPSRWRPNITEKRKPDLSHIVKFEEPYTYKRQLLCNLIEQCLDPIPQHRPTPEQMLGDKFFY